MLCHTYPPLPPLAAILQTPVLPNVDHATHRPNLEVRRVAGPHGDRRLPRVGFFAKVNIKAGEELCYRR